MAKEKTRKTVYLMVPTYVAFDVEEADEIDDGDENHAVGPPAVLPDTESLIQYLRDAIILDVDMESCDNPHGFGSAAICWDEAIEIDHAQWEEGGIHPCRGRQFLNVEMVNEDGILLSNVIDEANRAAWAAYQFMIRHGGDPQDDGKGARQGEIHFKPTTRRA